MHGPRILCVEGDSDPTRLQEELENAGYEVVSAKSVQQAAELLKSEIVDGIIIQCRPPECSCASAGSELTRIRPSVPVLLLSDTGEVSGVPLSYLREFIRKADSAESLMASLTN